MPHAWSIHYGLSIFKLIQRNSVDNLDTGIVLKILTDKVVHDLSTGFDNDDKQQDAHYHPFFF